MIATYVHYRSLLFAYAETDSTSFCFYSCNHLSFWLCLCEQSNDREHNVPFTVITDKRRLLIDLSVHKERQQSNDLNVQRDQYLEDIIDERRSAIHMLSLTADVRA